VQSPPLSDDGDTHLTRRAMLASTAAGLSVATSGCIREVRSAVNRDRLEQLSITITVQPADGDHQAIQIAHRLADTLEAVGIDTSFAMRSTEEFHREILLNHNFDCYIGRHPGGPDPDFLYEACHSRFAEEGGWQNPFGVASTQMDNLLEAQRQAPSDDRQMAVTECLEYLADEQPFVPICRMDDVRLVRTTAFDGWNGDALDGRLGYLDLETEASTLTGTVIYPSTSENLNPLSAEYRNQELFVELLYDSLATVGPDEESDDDTDLLAWLASDWTWDDDERRLTVTMRDGHTFHDGEPVTVDDIAFTYEFLADTARGGTVVPAPSPRYRGTISAFERLEQADDDWTFDLVVDGTAAVAERLLTVPILPAHIWEERAAEASVPGVQLAQGTTEALVTDNIPPIGSGPFAFDDVATRDYLELVRYDEHFTQSDDVDLPAVTVESLRALIDPRSPSAISMLEAGDAHVTFSGLEAYAIDDIETGDDLEMFRSTPTAFYHLGFNVRRAPFSNPFFRRAVARLLDKAWLVDDVFQGYATPLGTPVTSAWTPDSLAFDGRDPVVPFAGEDGDLETDVARARFTEAGYRYDGDRLVVRG